MDYEDIIKLEEESPMYSTGNQAQPIKNCMATFYDKDSEPNNHCSFESPPDSHEVSMEQAVDYVQNFVDIIDAPMEIIMNCFDRLDFYQEINREELKLKIIKRKKFLKRLRAKNRQLKVIPHQEVIQKHCESLTAESESEIKKKRNRVSAQISRDRKKVYFKELESKNLELQEEILRTKMENEKLKRALEDQSERRNKALTDSSNNKLTRLLIFLGIICLIGMLKDFTASTCESLSLFGRNGQKSFSVGEYFSSEEHSKMIEEGQQKVAQFLREEEAEFSSVDDENTPDTFLSPSTTASKPCFSYRQSLIGHLSGLKDEMFKEQQVKMEESD